MKFNAMIQCESVFKIYCYRTVSMDNNAAYGVSNIIKDGDHSKSDLTPS